MHNLDVSIIIPCHNGARYLPKLAASLRPLLTPQMEVILVDDGSTDGSAGLGQRLLPEAVCVTQTNRGLGATRNRAAEMARGEFLQLLDVDDTIEPGKFAAQLAFARKQALDVVYSDWRMVIVDHHDLETTEPWVAAEAKAEIVEALLGGWWYPPNAALVRADAFRAAGGCDATLGNTCEDFDLWVRLGIAGYRFGHVAGKYANYYRYLQVRSMSRKNPREFFDGEAGIILNAVHLLEEKRAATPARRAAAARRLYGVARNFYGFDTARYDELKREVFRLDPRFRPAGARSYRLCSRLFGLPAAEKLAWFKRGLTRGKANSRP